ncbi:MAG: hypothetical protein K0Q66_2249 [Chitinophagaceae bacterium]|nr:hypothetical protein [Chitinophagaceae bacterium]
MLAFAAIMVACNTGDDDAKDKIDSGADVKKDKIDSAAEAAKKRIDDSIRMKDSLDKVNKK